MGKQDFDVPVDQRIIQQLATQTVRHPIDAIVELVTNSDDSYKRLEAEKKGGDGYILIIVNYNRSINEIICVDHAEGMTKEELQKSAGFAAETSSYKQHKTVRGLFGRGLKEAIFSLGEGEITTVKNDKVVTLKLYKNKEGRYKGEWQEGYDANPTFRKASGIAGNGTIVKIKLLENRRVGNLENQVQAHCSFRNILTATNREVVLRLNNTWRKVQYQYPPRVLIVDKSISIDQKDSIRLIIYESSNLLDSVFEPQVANSGLLVEVEGNILDNTLLGYENEPAGLYFSGKIVCNGIATYLRNNDFGVLNADRSGIAWRHVYCSRIKEAVRGEFKTIIDRKNKELEKGENAAVSKPMERGLDKIAEELSKLFETEVEDGGILTKKERTVVAKNMLLIKPNRANVEVGVPRPLTVYVSKDLTEGGAIPSILSNNEEVEVDRDIVDLKPHKKHQDIFYGVFKVTGKKIGEVATITANIGEYKTVAEIAVKPQKKSKKKKKLSITEKGRWFNKVIANTTPTPIQRVRFNKDTANIEIFVKFPVVETYLKVDLSGVSQPPGRLLLSELLTEIFCREIALAKIEKGVGVNDVQGFLRVHDDQQKKYSEKIAEIVENNIWAILKAST